MAHEWRRFDLNMEIKDCAATCREFADKLIADLPDSQWKLSAFRTSNNNPVTNCRYNIIKLNWKDNDEALELILSACDCAMNSHGLSVSIKCLPKTEKFLQQYAMYEMLLAALNYACNVFKVEWYLTPCHCYPGHEVTQWSHHYDIKSLFCYCVPSHDTTTGLLVPSKEQTVTFFNLFV